MFRHVTAFFLFFVFALWTSANASALVSRVDQCNTGVVFCCVSVQSPSDPTVGALAGLLGVDVGSVNGLVGITCTQVSVVGVGGNSCSGQLVCCTGQNFGGLLVISCTPININL